MDRLIKYRWVIGLHIALMLVAYLITPLLSEDMYCYHYRIVALAWFILPAYLLFCLYNTKLKTLLIIFTLFTLNNLVDELFFDPSKFSWNELIFTLSILGVIIYKLKW